MSHVDATSELDRAAEEARSVFQDQLGVPDVEYILDEIGNQTFLKFIVGRRAPVYEEALRETQKSLADANPFHGLIGFEYRAEKKFSQSLEANALLNIITRATRHIAQGNESRIASTMYVPFQNNEDYKVAQPATHLIVGRRGVGKSTLIMRATQLLSKGNNMSVIIDMQPYSGTVGEGLFRDVIADITRELAESTRRRGDSRLLPIADELDVYSAEILNGDIPLERVAASLRRIVGRLTKLISAEIYLFLDDFHLIERDMQPDLLHLLHGCIKGAGGWLKVAGLRSLLSPYDPSTKKGLQVPGDAQVISLDLTLVDPANAERHLGAILAKLLRLVGVEGVGSVIAELALRRLVWANAGVPRDFLQMFGRSLEHAKRSNRPKITMTDTNLAIGEFGQQKMEELEQDARNEKNRLRRVVRFLENFCLEKKKINAFLVRSETSPERDAIQALSDLRVVHLIHPTITPHKAGERYEAFLLDYSLFTGFRRRPNIREMFPGDGRQFKAGELRKIPALPRDFLSEESPETEA